MYEVGQTVHVRDKGVSGLVAYVGTTEFAPGMYGWKLKNYKSYN